MAEGKNNGMYFIVGAVVVVAALLFFFMAADQGEMSPDGGAPVAESTAPEPPVTPEGN
ncbi:hypothetical protein [Paracoccus seriniphilus]|uniref:Uncharacterized protein n=1 Tax=Paracoccus seriniphilus TaxID=184748 RepID=A0A239PMN6_9RHOB|nr:hypothetical protein [Paracoccus seriniphilus]WCR13531.1 hypothetical protein JHW44_11455 [Paracoccus seriniphilus]SNT68887.1 hypothetical protein SAMN05444959_101448 [Paracoccus seriniphilus]